MTEEQKTKVAKYIRRIEIMNKDIQDTQKQKEKVIDEILEYLNIKRIDNTDE